MGNIYRNLANVIFFISLIYSNTIFVPTDYSTIQEAIDASEDGDIIDVSPGTYSESLSITHSITLTGQSGAIIDASGLTNGIVIGSDNEDDGYIVGIEVSGFEIIGDLSTMCGIQILPGSQNITISENIIHGMRLENNSSALRASYGILSWGIDDNFAPSGINILNNEIYDIRAIGISFGSFSSNIIVQDNNYIHDIIAVDVPNHGLSELLSIGVNAQYSDVINISDNTFTDLKVAIAQTWVGNVTINDNTFENIISFYAVDQYSYEQDNMEVDIDSFTNYVKSFFTLPISEVLPSPVEAVGWFSNINDAVNAADEGSEVLLDSGTFDGNIVWPDKNIKLIGSGIGNTIINGDGVDRVIKFNSPDIENASLIRGVTIQNGNGGILIDGVSPTIDSCQIINNTAIGDVGGGIKIIGLGEIEVDPVISNNLIMYNKSIGDESTFGGGAGIYVSTGATPIISKNLIAFNDATIGSVKGAGIMSSYASPIIENNTIYGNTSWQYTEDDSSSIAGGIYVTGFSNIEIEKTIIWGNSPGALVATNLSSPEFTNSAMDEICLDDETNTINCEADDNVINLNPLFCGADDLDFTLADNSPCILNGGFMGAYDTGDCGNSDCNFIPGGTAYLDECNNCVGGDTGLEPCLGI